MVPLALGWPAPILLAAIALLLWPPPAWPGRQARGRWGTSSRDAGRRMSARTRRALLTAAVVVAVGVLVGAPAWVLAAVGALGCIGGRLLPERARSPARADSGADATSLAGVLDLFATAMESGLTVPQAISAVATLDDSSAAAILREVGQLLALGVPPVEAWRSAADDRDLAPVAAAAVRSAVGGVTMADAAREAARDIRDRSRAAAERAAARAEVTMTAPLALCFLPAFLCLGLAPVVIGLVRDLHLF